MEETIPDAFVRIAQLLASEHDRDLLEAAEELRPFAHDGSYPVPVLTALLRQVANSSASDEARKALMIPLYFQEALKDANSEIFRTLRQVLRRDPSPIAREAAADVLARAEHACVPELTKALRDKDGRVRAEAATGLIGHDPTPFTKATRKAYGRETDVDAKRALLRLISGWGLTKDLYKLLDALDDPELRKLAISLLHYDYDVPSLLDPDEHDRIPMPNGYLELLRQVPLYLDRGRRQAIGKRIFNRLCQIVLDDSDAECRAEATGALWFCPGTTDVLIKALSDEDDKVIKMVLRNLESDDGAAQTIPALIECYGRNPHHAPAICDIMKTRWHELAGPFLLRAFKEAKDDKMRHAIIKGYSGSPLPHVIPLFQRALESNAKDLRKAAAEQLSEVDYWYDTSCESGQKTADEMLLSAFARDTTPSVRLKIIDGIGTVGSKRCIEPLINAIPSASASVQAAIVKALGNIDPVTATPALLDALESPITRVKYAAADALSKAQHPASLPTLVARIDDPDTRSDKRERLIEKLGYVGGASVADKLLTLLDDECAFSAAAAAQAMQYSATPEVTAELIKRLRNDSFDHYEVLYKSMNVLAANDVDGGAEAVGYYLDYDDPRIRRRALMAYTSFTSVDPMPALHQALHDEDEHVREQAEDILLELEEGDERDFFNRGTLHYE